MIYSNKTAWVSGGLVLCMFGHAAEGAFQGQSPSEIHLITSVPLSTGTATISTATLMHYNAIHDAEYRAAPEARALKSDGMTEPSRTAKP